MFLGVHIITDPQLRNLWYDSHAHNGVPGYYAYGVKQLKCVKTQQGYRIRNTVIPQGTPIYRYGHPTSAPLVHPRGPYLFKCQLPGVSLPHSQSIEEKIFDYRGYKEDKLKRTTQNKLKVRCGKKQYRIVLLKTHVDTPKCYIFGTNIRVPTRLVPEWMRREHIVLPHPARTSRNAIKSFSGTVYHTGRPKIGKVYIAGIQMKCSAIKQLCTIRYNGHKYYAHPSVTFSYKQYHRIHK